MIHLTNPRWQTFLISKNLTHFLHMLYVQENWGPKKLFEDNESVKPVS